MAAKSGRATKQDVELARQDVDLARVAMRQSIGMVVAYGVVAALCIAALALPLWAVHSIIQEVGGKKTVVQVSIGLSITFAVSVVGNLAQFIKGSSQRSEIKRLRARQNDLERQLGIEVTQWR